MHVICTIPTQDHVTLRMLGSDGLVMSETGKLIDITRRTRPRKLTGQMMAMLNGALSEDDELTARRARSLLVEKFPSIQVSLPTIMHLSMSSPTPAHIGRDLCVFCQKYTPY